MVVAEGEQPGDSFRIAQQVKEKTGLESRICILGHAQRGGSPTARDRLLATTLGIHAVKALLDGKSGAMVGEVKGEITYTPLRETWEHQKHPNGDLHTLAKLLCS